MIGDAIHTLKEPLLKLRGKTKFIDYSIDPATGCWNVVSHAPDGAGYIQVKRNRRQMMMHRYSYELAYGPIPDGFDCCHHCDNPVCINPEHLFLGTQKDNMQDMVQKGRTTWGEAHGSSKLTEVDVKAIRTDRISSQRKLGREYGVHQTQIGRIKRGEQWKHIPVLEKVA